MTVLADLTEPITDLPPLEREPREHLGEDGLSWVEDGYVLLRHYITEPLIDAYCEAWREVNDESTGRSRWPACAYMHSDAIKDLCLNDRMVDVLGPLVGGDVGLHLCLTGWRSTTRDWHQDDYLNPPFVNAWYAAAWIALDHISPDSGPFEFIPGSHKWPRLRRERIIDALGLDARDPDWPAKTEKQLTPLVEDEIVDRRARVMTPHMERGDVLIWHGGLYHRGTVAMKPDTERRSCIAHYSAVHKRLDMDDWGVWGNGYYYNCPQPLTDLRVAP